ncbi:MAG: KOW domain-containing RNA-binding protein [Oscillospiraceae bacterium]|jgi:ribosomal protein L14E/L6E/L27E|nr:KOW domain-containing RNA-binding protein [Oscillospiraceae bacterium]
MVSIKTGSIVKSSAGRDKDRFFVVLGLEGNFAMIADGDLRRVDKPKRKKLMHLKPTRSRLDLPEAPGNSLLREELRKFCQKNFDQEGGGVVV